MLERSSARPIVVTVTTECGGSTPARAVVAPPPSGRGPSLTWRPPRTRRTVNAVGAGLAPASTSAPAAAPISQVQGGKVDRIVPGGVGRRDPTDGPMFVHGGHGAERRAGWQARDRARDRAVSRQRRAGTRQHHRARDRDQPKSPHGIQPTIEPLDVHDISAGSRPKGRLALARIELTAAPRQRLNGSRDRDSRLMAWRSRPGNGKHFWLFDAEGGRPRARHIRGSLLR